MVNAAGSPTFYEFDSTDLFQLYKEMDANDEEPVVVYHSHTATEAYPSRDKAEAIARDIGLADWDARHESDEFKFTRPFALTAIGNTAAFWNREQLGIELRPGVDEVSLALVADAWSRTYRSRAVTFARTAGALQSRNGIRILPDQVAANWPAKRLLP